MWYTRSMAVEIRPRGHKQKLRGGDSYLGRARRSAGLSLRHVEARTGIIRGDISKIERGRLNPTPEESRKLLDCYAQVQSEQSSD